MDFSVLVVFFLVVVGVSVIPGPSTLIAFAHGARYGGSRALMTAAGNSTASMLQAAAASAGLGLVITTSAFLFLLIKYAGALYLIYMGVQIWRTAAHRLAFASEMEDVRFAWKRLFSGGFLVAASNPKAVVFFTALFPQFLTAGHNTLAQMTAMVAVIGVVAFVVAALYGYAGAWLRRLDFSRRVMKAVYKATGGLFVASGVGLAVSRN
ncbi:LysE family translocator [uncultured Roseibium sp.]|uniref:LysE family translocator n=1 Tax=uncultured Roseibium sp. TaxID=1936171 RepID=UPI003216CA68